ncbi:MAG TPA: cell division protein SepF [Amnibacterium sp.]|jgi:cell division inhibitor SepF|nr:cell division protein SepF [Amnibacterium sp.]
MSNPIRKSMVWLGLADDQYEYDEPVEPISLVSTATPRATVTPLPKRQAVRSHVPEMNEILTVHPRQYRDAQGIAEHFREGTPIIINLTQMTESEARRLVDFASGLSTGLRGRIERVTSKVFLLSPEHIAVSGEEPGADSELDAEFTG